MKRRTTRRLLSDLYTFYSSASLTAHHILSLSRSFSPHITWEETSLTHWAKLLDILLLESNGGSWALSSEPSVDYALRAFLEYAFRANPDGDVPPGLDPMEGAKLKSLKYGRTRDYGLLPQYNNNRQSRRRQPQGLLGSNARPLNPPPPAKLRHSQPNWLPCVWCQFGSPAQPFYPTPPPLLLPPPAIPNLNKRQRKKAQIFHLMASQLRLPLLVLHGLHHGRTFSPAPVAALHWTCASPLCRHQ